MSALPNPDVYLNHFTPSEASQFETARNVSLAVLGAMIWDILLYIPHDFEILRCNPFRIVTFCFVASRAFALAATVLTVIMQTGPKEICRDPSHAFMILLAMMSTTFLFLQRLRAVYAGHRIFQAIAGFLWLASCGVMTLIFFGVEAAHVPGTGYCVQTAVKPGLIAAGFVFFGFDTFVFLAISYKLASGHSAVVTEISWETAVSGRALPRLSRAVLQGGQQYYLITICLHIPVSILIALPSIPPIYKLMLPYPLACLSASMASRVFRTTRQHARKIETRSGITVLSNLNFAPVSRLWRSTVNVTGQRSQGAEGTPPLFQPEVVSLPPPSSEDMSAHMEKAIPR